MHAGEGPTCEKGRVALGVPANRDRWVSPKPCDPSRQAPHAQRLDSKPPPAGSLTTELGPVQRRSSACWVSRGRPTPTDPTRGTEIRRYSTRDVRKMGCSGQHLLDSPAE